MTSQVGQPHKCLEINACALTFPVLRYRMRCGLLVRHSKQHCPLLDLREAVVPARLLHVCAGVGLRDPSTSTYLSFVCQRLTSGCAQVAACMLVELVYLLFLLLVMPLRNPYMQKEVLMSMVQRYCMISICRSHHLHCGGMPFAGFTCHAFDHLGHGAKFPTCDDGAGLNRAGSTWSYSIDRLRHVPV